MGRERALLLALALVGCDRAPAKESAPSPTAQTKVVVPTEAAPIVASPARVEPSVIGPAPGESAPVVAAAIEPAPSVGSTTGAPSPVKSKPAPASKGAPLATEPVAPAPAAPAPPAPAPPVPPQGPTTLVSNKLFRIELAPLAPCTIAAACGAKLVVHALGGYKVNAEYPTKFVATSGPGVTVDGTGSFAVASKATGTMTLSFRAAAAGAAKISGALKLSVCTDEICEIAAPVVAFDVAVAAP